MFKQIFYYGVSLFNKVVRLNPRSKALGPNQNKNTQIQLVKFSAAWLSETVLRGRGPGASGFESHRSGRIFSKEGTSAGPWMCVYVYPGLTVGWWKEERHSSDTTARSAGFES
jgi:hypothetical protein